MPVPVDGARGLGAVAVATQEYRSTPDVTTQGAFRHASRDISLRPLLSGTFLSPAMAHLGLFTTCPSTVARTSTLPYFASSAKVSSNCASLMPHLAASIVL